MKKEEVELIIIRVASDGQEALSIKIYKDGTVCRCGVGATPSLGIYGMSFFGNSKFFDPLIEKIPEYLLEKSINLEEETPNGCVEYAIAFFGVSKNSYSGERAEWTKSTGIRLKLDRQSSSKDKIIGFLDYITLEAIELTNEWYFDIMMLSKFKMRSSTLPQETILMQPKTEIEIHTDYENYINMMLASTRKWKMTFFVQKKKYEREGVVSRGIVQQDEHSVSVNFFKPEKTSAQRQSNADKSPWWKVW